MALVDLHSAAASGDLARLRQRWWLNKYRINGYNRDKQTPLHLACINGHADVVEFLVKKKCKLNPCDKMNKTPLMKAVEHKHRDCAAILLEHGASHNHRSASGDTALHFAVMFSSKSLVELLLEHGADIDAKNKLGYTPLILAITENCEEIVKFLLQKGADVNAQDNVHRTPLTAATVSGNKKTIQLLLHHGAVFPKSDKGHYSCRAFTKMVQNDSSCYETTPVIPLETPALGESCDVPTEEAAGKKDNGPAADQNKVCVRSITMRLNRGVLPAAAAAEVKQEDGDSSWSSEPNSEVVDKGAATVVLPADVCRMFPGLSVAKECSKGAWQAAGAAKEEDRRSLCNPKHLSDLTQKVINPVQCPAGKRRRVAVHSVAEERGKGALQPGGGAVKKEDTDSPWDSEPDHEGQGNVWANAWCPAANSNRLDARSAAVERSKGVLPAAEVKKEDGDSSWDSEPFSEIVEELFAREQGRAAGHKGVGLRSAVAEPVKAGGAGEDDDSPWDSETDSEGEWKVSAPVQLPAANSNRLDACSAAVEHGKEVFKQTWREAKKEDRGLQPAGQEAKQEDDSPWDSEVLSSLDIRILSCFGRSTQERSQTDSEGQSKVLAVVHLPAADRNRVGVSSAAVEHSKAARAEQKEHFIPSSENKGEDIQLKVDSSTQTDSEQDEQPLARQKLDKILRKNSLEEAPLGTVKTRSRKEQKLLLEKLERCKARLKDLKEHLNRNDYYAESWKNALKEKKVIKILRNVQGRLAESLDSSAAAVLQLEERFQRLDMKMAKLEDTIQQQAKTIELFETIQ